MYLGQIEVPGQLDGFNYTVEEDDRLQFFDHHVIHLEWDKPTSRSLIMRLCTHHNHRYNIYYT